MRVYKMTLTALMVALAVIFHYVEGFIPVLIAIPGFKLGLANIVGVFVLFYMGPSYYVSVQILRILLVALISTGFGTPFLLALGGGLLSIIGSLLLYKFTMVSIYSVSIVGAFLHVLGQIITYLLIVQTFYMLLYLPILASLSMLAGGLLAYLASLIIKVLPEFNRLTRIRRR